MIAGAQVTDAERTGLTQLAVATLEPLFVRLRQVDIQGFCTSIDKEVSAMHAMSSSGDGWQTSHGIRWVQITTLIARLRDMRRRIARQKQEALELELQLDQTESKAERLFLLRRFIRRNAPEADRLPQDPQSIHGLYDLEAVQERLLLCWDKEEVRQEIALALISACVADEIDWRFTTSEHPIAGLQEFVQTSDAMAALLRFTGRQHPWRFRVAAFQGLSRIAAIIPAAWWAVVFPRQCYDTVYQQCYNADDHVWVQVAAFDCLLHCDSGQWLQACGQRLADGGLKKSDDLFVRHHLVTCLGHFEDNDQAVIPLLAGTLLPADISDYVRQGALAALASCALDEARPHIARALGLLSGEQPDPCPQVRGAGLRALVQGLASATEEDRHIVINLIRRAIRVEKDELPLRVLFSELPEALDYDSTACALPLQPPDYCEPFLLAIDELIASADHSLRLRRLAEEAREAIIVRSVPGFRLTVKELDRRLEKVSDGGFLRWALPEEVGSIQNLSRILVYLCRRRLGLAITVRRDGRHLRLQKGDRFVFKWWRWRYELLHPGPDKRAGFQHSVGRVFVGSIRVHPLLGGEESPTKVPGEPLYLDAEGQWRRFLPLVDDCIEALGKYRKCGVQLYSSQGMTVVRAPERWRAAVRARRELVRHYDKWSNLRNRPLPDNTDGRHPFILALQELGLQIAFHPNGWLDSEGHWRPLVDASMQAYFGMPVVEMPASAKDIAADLSSVGVTLLTGAAPAGLEQSPADIENAQTELMLPVLPDEDEEDSKSAHDTQMLIAATQERVERRRTDAVRSTSSGTTRRTRRQASKHNQESVSTAKRRRRREIIDERDQRQTAMHHRSVTQQIRQQSEEVDRKDDDESAPDRGRS